LQFWRLAALCKSAARVICVDTNVINWLRLYGSIGHKAAEKCTYLPNYFDTAVFTPPTRFLIEARFSGRHLIYVRRFERPRGALLFVEMCKLLRDRGFQFSASMIGWGNEQAAVCALIEKYGLEETIRVAEADFDAVSEILRTAAVAIVPTIYSEGTSLSCIEAIGMGIPVVTTDVGGLGNLVIPGFNGYIVKASADQLATSVEAALSSLDQYMSLATHCIQMRDSFTFGKWRESVIHILRESGLLPEAHSEAAIPAAPEPTRA
jgi:glycosyltransferase involved in cell wall biosynthesis